MGAVSVDQRAPIGPLPVGAKLGRYEILAKLAAGGMAIVYVARAHGVAGFERLVAIKVLHGNLAHEEEFIKMFLDEARLAASIRHPNVVPTIDISDSEKSGYFIVMEYIEGDHLGQLLSNANKAGEKLSVAVTLRIIGDALGGLGAAHDLTDEHGRPQNLVHRDVSPHNIMVGRDGVARLTDFGVAKAEDRLTHTRDGQVKGKLAYMAPEQAASGTTDTRSDLFSMGVILWECVTGHRLMRAETTAATLHKLLHGEIPKVSSVDPSLWPLDPVLEKALARDPAARFQTAEEFARALEDVAGNFQGTASLREVGRMVKHYAAVKLKRDKKLIDEALKALRPSSNTLEIDGMVALDEVSSPSSPSTSDISIMAGAAPASLFSKVGTVLANDTMPGTRRASRRTPPPVSLPPSVPGSAGRRRNVEKSMSVDVEPLPPFHALHDTLELEPKRHQHKTLLAVALVAAALLGLVWTWTSSSGSDAEVVRVEEMDSTRTIQVGAVHQAVAPPDEDEAETPAAAVVPVATVPAPVTERTPETQAIAPVVPSVAPKSSGAAQSVRKREAAPPARSSKPARRQREREVTPTPRAMRPNDVIPNPYHD